MGKKHFIHISRVNVKTAGDDHVLLAVYNGEEPFLIHCRNITGEQPSVLERDRGLFGPVDVPLHDLRSFETQLTGSSRFGDLLVVVIHVNQLRVSVGDGEADGAGFGLCRRKD